MKMYRVTYAFNREDINVITVEEDCIYNAVCSARTYIEKEHGFLKFNEIIGLGIVEIIE
jgi:hypothetical protein